MSTFLICFKQKILLHTSIVAQNKKTCKM